MKLTPAEVGGIMPFFGLGSLTAYFAGQLGDRFPTKVVISTASLVLAVLGFFLYLPGLSIGMYRLLALGVGTFGAAIVYTNLAGCHIKSLRRSMASKGSSMFVSSIYAGGALGGLRDETGQPALEERSRHQAVLDREEREQGRVDQKRLAQRPGST